MQLPRRVNQRLALGDSRQDEEATVAHLGNRRKRHLFQAFRLDGDRTRLAPARPAPAA